MPDIVKLIFKIVIGITLICVLLALLPILLILIILFPNLKAKAGFNMWNQPHNPQYQQNNDTDVVDVEATVVEDDALPPPDQK